MAGVCYTRKVRGRHDTPERDHTMTDSDPDAPLTEVHFDLTADETARRAAVLAAIGPHWDPAAVLADEREAERLLHSGLDAQQRAIHRRLSEAGILPPLPRPRQDGDGRAAP